MIKVKHVHYQKRFDPQLQFAVAVYHIDSTTEAVEVLLL
jgi:hypothetical protein